MASKVQQSQAVTDKDVAKAQARELIACRKLERLKDRYQKLEAASTLRITRHEQEKAKLEHELEESRLEGAEAAARYKALRDEASMWKSQLFDQLDKLEAKELALQEVEVELTQAHWMLAQPETAEDTLVEGEPVPSGELAEALEHIEALHKDLTAAAARVHGLKNLGVCLTAKLQRETSQNKILKRENYRLETVAEEQTELAQSKELELEALKTQLFEVRRQLLALRLESQSWEMLKTGLDHRQEDLTAEMGENDEPLRVPDFRTDEFTISAPQMTTTLELTPRKFLHRASKAVSGWFKLPSRS